MLKLGVGSHPKLARLTDAEFRAHVAGVLAVAAASPVRGCLLVGDLPAEAADIARAAGVSTRVATTAIRKLKAVGVLYENEEFRCLCVHDWDDVNPQPKHDSTAAERQRRHRSRRDNRNGHGAVTAGVTPPEVKKGKKDVANAPSSSSSDAKRADVKPSDEDRQLCRLLAEAMRERNPKAKVRSQSRWLTDMRLLRERDGNSPAEIERAIRWVFHDDFWGGVIRSPGNLREHFPAIWDKLSRAGSRRGGSVEDSRSFLTRRGAS
jgi:hypothetical protein